MFLVRHDFFKQIQAAI